MKKYFYLQGSEKKGPFTEKELSHLNLNHKTLIWTEGLDKWKPLSDFPDLLKIIPPPLPENLSTDIKKSENSQKIVFSFLCSFFFLILSLIIVYFIMNHRKKEHKQEITKRVENIFNNKSIVCDGVNYSVDGELKKIQKPLKGERNSLNLDYIYDLFKYESMDKNIVEKFTCISGGFTYKKLKKVDRGYELEVISSTNMYYTSRSYYRPSLQEAYNTAYDYFLTENPGCQTPGMYDLITNFEYLRNDYFQVKNVVKPSYPNSKHWWTSNDSYIDYEHNFLLYKTEGWYFEISERELKIDEDYVKFSLITSVISVLLFLSLFIANPFKW